MNIVSQKPDVMEWKPESEEDIYYTFDGENIIANYNSKVGKLEEVSTLPIYYIKKNHYKVRMPEIAHYLNFFTRFYDLDRDTFFSMMALKYAIDINLQMTQKEFARKVEKTEPEVSRWLGGTHNFTLRTLAKISSVLGEDLIRI